MLIIIFSIIFMLGVLIHHFAKYHEDKEDLLFFGLLKFIGFGVVLFWFCLITIPMTSGLVANYGQGEQAGYVTFIEKSGLIWKTWEGRIQEGVGEQVNAGGILTFSVLDATIVKELKEISGSRKRVMLTYSSWLIMPYSFGSSDCIVTNIRILE